MKAKALNSWTTTHTPPQPARLTQHHSRQFFASVLFSGRRVRFMLDSMKAAGCPVDGDQFVQCDSCEPLISGAMYQKPSTQQIGVLMCQNRLKGKSQDYYDTVLAHELIHAFDYCRAHTDFNSLSHHACTEVRAANLSGECTWLREAKRGILRLRGHHEECVRRRAVISVLGNPGVRTSEEAKEAVGKVFDRCYRDVQPHGSIPW